MYSISRSFAAMRLLSLADFYVKRADKIVGGPEPGEVGHSLQVPHDDAWLHASFDATITPFQID
jgi:hypothetical protein